MESCFIALLVFVDCVKVEMLFLWCTVLAVIHMDVVDMDKTGTEMSLARQFSGNVNVMSHNWE